MWKRISSDVSQPMQASASENAVRRRTRNGSLRQASTTSGTSATAHSATIKRSAGKIVNRKADGVGIDDHQIDEIRRHHQHVIFELREQHQQADHHQRQRAGDGRPPYQREPKKFRMPQASRNAAIAVSVVSVATMMARAAACGMNTSEGRQTCRQKPRKTIPRAASRRSRINRRTRMTGARARK